METIQLKMDFLNAYRDYKFSDKKAKKFWEMKPDLIGVVLGIRFYEDPVYGDEVGLIAAFNGELFTTDHYDVPTPEEMVSE